jgi:epoxyqueuosine reductase
MSLKELIQAETERLGFLLSGVMDVTPPAHMQKYQDWLDSGLHAGMDYLAAEGALLRRANPALIMPQALSVLVVALRYPAPPYYSIESPSPDARGRVAAYAWGVDYHEIIPPLLAKLPGTLQKYLGRPIQSRPYTDSGPILERDFAQQAGLGWSGKNTCLISPRHGSYFLLGELFIDAQVEPDPPFEAEHCGACQRCIQACPTHAILESRTIDANRCISYLTIENKGKIPPELRAATGDWVFGCDMCQVACPWNRRFSQAEGHPALEPDPLKARPVLKDELALTPQQFNQKFRHSPILRAKRRGYLRNIAVAAGNQRDTNVVPALIEALEGEPEPLVRSHAAWALGQMNTSPSRQALDRALRSEPDPAVKDEILSALQQ